MSVRDKLRVCCVWHGVNAVRALGQDGAAARWSEAGAGEEVGVDASRRELVWRCPSCGQVWRLSLSPVEPPS